MSFAVKKKFVLASGGKQEIKIAHKHAAATSISVQFAAKTGVSVGNPLTFRVHWGDVANTVSSTTTITSVASATGPTFTYSGADLSTNTKIIRVEFLSNPQLVGVISITPSRAINSITGSAWKQIALTTVQLSSQALEVIPPFRSGLTAANVHTNKLTPLAISDGLSQTRATLDSITIGSPTTGSGGAVGQTTTGNVFDFRSATGYTLLKTLWLNGSGVVNTAGQPILDSGNIVETAGFMSNNLTYVPYVPATCKALWMGLTSSATDTKRNVLTSSFDPATNGNYALTTYGFSSCWPTAQKAQLVTFINNLNACKALLTTAAKTIYINVNCANLSLTTDAATIAIINDLVANYNCTILYNQVA